MISDWYLRSVASAALPDDDSRIDLSTIAPSRGLSAALNPSLGKKTLEIALSKSEVPTAFDTAGHKVEVAAVEMANRKARLIIDGESFAEQVTLQRAAWRFEGSKRIDDTTNAIVQKENFERIENLSKIKEQTK